MSEVLAGIGEALAETALRSGRPKISRFGQRCVLLGVPEAMWWALSRPLRMGIALKPTVRTYERAVGVDSSTAARDLSWVLSRLTRLAGDESEDREDLVRRAAPLLLAAKVTGSEDVVVAATEQAFLASGRKVPDDFRQLPVEQRTAWFRASIRVYSDAWRDALDGAPPS